MSNQYKIGDIAKVKGGKRLPKGHDFVEQSSIPYLRVVDMINGRIDDSDIKYVSLQTEKLISNYKITDQDIYVTIAGTIGNFGIIPSKFNNAQLTENAAKLCEIDLSQFNLDYLIQKFSSEEIQGQVWKFIGIGGGVPKLALHRIQKIEFTAPPLPTQRKIAHILSTIDGQIEKTEAIITKYQAVKQGMLQDLFTRGIDVRTGQLRPRYEDAPELYQESALGMIPKEWEVSTIGKACLIQNQFRKPISSEIRETMLGKYPYYGPTGIQDYIDEFRVKGRYVLIGEDGDHFLKWSKQEMTLLVDGEFNVNNHAHILEGTEACLTEWIHTFFAHRDITFYLTRQGAGRYKLNKAALKSIVFPLPSVTEQRMLIERLTSINSRLKLDREVLSKLQVLKQGMMQDLLSGKVEVTV
ncbi:restriction endonuclease subunit S [Spirosoma litoris]